MNTLRQELRVGEALSAHELLRQCQDPTMRHVLTLVGIGAKSRSVILRGETGTGKEVVAKALHEKGSRSKKGFVVLDCANQNRDIMGSELFGHEKGAFTGAEQQHIGSFERADGGTLFLDEIGELPIEMQSRLLRVLEEKTFNRVGGKDILTSDFNLISATNSNLEKMVAKGTFRQDLYYRLNVFQIPIPPLRDRPKDIVQLATYFADQLSDGSTTLAVESEDLLRGYSWPGNIRELRNMIERAVLMANGDEIIHPNHIVFAPCFTGEVAAVNESRPQSAGNENSQQVDVVMDKLLALLIKQKTENDNVAETMEKLMIQSSLRLSGNNISASGKIIGIGRQTFYNKMKKYGINP